MNKYIKLIMAIGGIVLFIYILAPIINSLPIIKPFQENAKKWDINTAAFFYTDDVSSNENITEYTNL